MMRSAAPAWAEPAPLPVIGQSRRRIGQVPPVAVLAVSAIFLPEAFGFQLADFRLTASRLILLALAPVMLLGFPQLMATTRYRLVLSDVLMPVLAFWMILAPSQIDGFAVGLKSGGANALDFIGPYLLVRCALVSINQVHATVRLFCIFAAVAGVLAIVDTMTHSAFWRHEVAHLTGYTYYAPERPANSPELFRLGLYRAQSIFEHPIMLGVVMSFALLLTRDLSGWLAWSTRAGCGLGLFLSLSSGPWDLFVVGLGLIVYTRICRFAYRWVMLCTAILLAVAAIYLATKNPLGWAFNHLMFDVSTGYFRLMVWEVAGRDVMTSPVFGIGFVHSWLRPQWMPVSVDSFWLVTALGCGIPGVILTLLSLVGATSLPAWPGAGIGARDLRLAATFGIILFLTLLCGFSNDFWGASKMTIAVVMGMRAVIGQLAAGGRPSEPAQDLERRYRP